MWIGRFAKPLTQHGIQMAYKRIFLRAGISGPKIGPHTLRHTFATMYLRAGEELGIFKRYWVTKTSKRQCYTFTSPATTCSQITHGIPQ